MKLNIASLFHVETGKIYIYKIIMKLNIASLFHVETGKIYKIIMKLNTASLFHVETRQHKGLNDYPQQANHNCYEAQHRFIKVSTWIYHILSPHPRDNMQTKSIICWAIHAPDVYRARTTQRSIGNNSTNRLSTTTAGLSSPAWCHDWPSMTFTPGLLTWGCPDQPWPVPCRPFTTTGLSSPVWCHERPTLTLTQEFPPVQCLSSPAFSRSGLQMPLPHHFTNN